MPRKNGNWYSWFRFPASLVFAQDCVVSVSFSFCRLWTCEGLFFKISLLRKLFFEDTHRQTNYGKARTSAITNAPLSRLLYISNTPLSRVQSKVWVFVTNKNKMSNYVELAWADSWGFLCSVSFLLKILMHFLSCMTRDRNYGKARTSAIANAPLSRLLYISNSPLSRVKSNVCVFVTNKKLDQDE